MRRRLYAEVEEDVGGAAEGHGEGCGGFVAPGTEAGNHAGLEGGDAGGVVVELRPAKGRVTLIILYLWVGAAPLFAYYR